MEFTQAYPAFSEILEGYKYDHPEFSQEIYERLASRVEVPVIDLTNDDDDDDEVTITSSRPCRPVSDLTGDDAQVPFLDEVQSSVAFSSPPTPVVAAAPAPAPVPALQSKKRTYAWLQETTSFALRKGLGQLENPLKKFKRQEAGELREEDEREPSEVFHQKKLAGLQPSFDWDAENKRWFLTESGVAQKGRRRKGDPKVPREPKRTRAPKKQQARKGEADNIAAPMSKPAPERCSGESGEEREVSQTLERNKASTEAVPEEDLTAMGSGLFLEEDPVSAEAVGDFTLEAHVPSPAQGGDLFGEGAEEEEELTNMVAAMTAEWKRQEEEEQVAHVAREMVDEDGDLDDLFEGDEIVETEQSVREVEKAPNEDVSALEAAMWAEFAREDAEKEAKEKAVSQVVVAPDDADINSDSDSLLDDELSEVDNEEVEQGVAQKEQQYAFAWKPEEDWSEEE